MAKGAKKRTTQRATQTEPGGLTELVRRRLLQLQRESGVPSTTIAERTGLSAKWVQRYFAGSRGDRPTLDQLDALCRFFNLRLADVLLGVSPETGLDREDEAWLWIGRKLSAAERDHLKRMAALLLRARGQKTHDTSDGPLPR